MCFQNGVEKGWEPSPDLCRDAQYAIAGMRAACSISGDSGRGRPPAGRSCWGGDDSRLVRGQVAVGQRLRLDALGRVERGGQPPRRRAADFDSRVDVAWVSIRWMM